MGFPQPDLFIISTAVQGVLHGVAVFMFAVTMYMLVRDPRRQLRYDRGIVFDAAGNDLRYQYRASRGFITIGPNLLGGAATYFMDSNQFMFLIKGCSFPLQILILDGVVIYRAYVAWQTCYVITLPVAAWCGLLVSTIGLFYTFINDYVHPAHASSPNTTVAWITARYSLTLVTNAIATVCCRQRARDSNHGPRFVQF